MTTTSKGSFTRRTTATTVTIDNLSLSLEKLEEILLNKTSIDQTLAMGRLNSIDIYELFQILKMLKKEHGFIALENHVLENFLEKNDPQLLHAVNEAMERQANKFIQFTKETGGMRGNQMYQTPRSQSGISLTDRPSRFRATSSPKEQQIGSVKLSQDWRLTYTIKNELTEKLVNELNKEWDEKRKKGIKTLREINARIEELKYRETDISGTLKGFLQNVVDIAYDKKSGTIPTEKYIKYFVNWLKNALAMISTMRLKIQTLKESCAHQRAIIIKKSDLGGCITSVDFEALKLRRSDYLKILDDRNENLLRIKQVSAKASTTLSVNKNILVEIETRWKHICDRIVDGKHQIKKMEGESKVVQDEIVAVVNDIKELKLKIEDYSAPSVEDYIEMKDRLVLLERERSSSKRRNQLLKLKLINKKKALQKLHEKYK